MSKIRLGKDATISGHGLDNNQVRNVSIEFAKAEADASVRGGDGYRATVGTLKECTVEAEIVIRGDDDLEGIRESFESGDAEALTFSDGGGSLTNLFECMSLSISQELEGPIIATATFKTTAEPITSGSGSGGSGGG
jgi:hypothetical protein